MVAQGRHTIVRIQTSFKSIVHSSSTLLCFQFHLAPNYPHPASQPGSCSYIQCNFPSCSFKTTFIRPFFAPCVSSHTHLSNPKPPAHFHSLITRVIHKWTVDLLRSLPGETVANWTKYARTVSGTLSKIRAEQPAVPVMSHTGKWQDCQCAYFDRTAQRSPCMLIRAGFWALWSALHCCRRGRNYISSYVLQCFLSSWF